MIGANIKQLRLKKGMTQKNLADKLFVSAQAVSRWENNEVEPSIGTLVEMAKIFEVSVDEILGVETKEDTKEDVKENIHTEKSEQPQEAAKNEALEDKPDPTPPPRTGPRKPARKVAGYCGKCNAPIYNPFEVVHKNDIIVCQKCLKKQKEEELRRKTLKAETNRKRSFIYGGLAAFAALIIVLSLWSYFPAPAQMVALVFPLTIFSFVSCCFLNNNSLIYLFFRIASFSIRLPGLIFTFDLDGCLWFIGMKILFFFLGILGGIAMFLIALIVCCVCSIFVYPYAIITNIKHPEKTKEDF